MARFARAVRNLDTYPGTEAGMDHRKIRTQDCRNSIPAAPLRRQHLTTDPPNTQSTQRGCDDPQPLSHI